VNSDRFLKIWGTIWLAFCVPMHSKLWEDSSLPRDATPLHSLSQSQMFNVLLAYRPTSTHPNDNDSMIDKLLLPYTICRLVSIWLGIVPDLMCSLVYVFSFFHYFFVMSKFLSCVHNNNLTKSKYKHSLTFRVRHYVAIATKPVHRLQFRSIMHN